MYIIILVRNNKDERKRTEIPVFGGRDLDALKAVLIDETFYSPYFSENTPHDFMYIERLH